MILLGLSAASMSGHDEKRDEGDIIVAIPDRHYIGTKETKTFIWVPAQSLQADIAPVEAVAGTYKRRYQISFADLADTVPKFDPVRARDITDEYQPFFIRDDVTGNFIAEDAPLVVDGLIWDKVETKYIA
jgi:hypothetical protein